LQIGDVARTLHLRKSAESRSAAFNLKTVQTTPGLKLSDGMWNKSFQLCSHERFDIIMASTIGPDKATALRVCETDGLMM